MTVHPFVDPIHDATCTLHIGDLDCGIEHPDCPYHAEIYPDLDAFYCTHCGWNGRITGAWFLDLLDHWIASNPAEDDAAALARLEERDHVLGPLAEDLD